MKRADKQRTGPSTVTQSQEFSVPRGMRDIEPNEMARRVWLTEKIYSVLSSYGFKLVEPSPIENIETLEAKSRPDIKDQIFWVKGNADRELRPRFEPTDGMTKNLG